MNILLSIHPEYAAMIYHVLTKKSYEREKEIWAKWEKIKGGKNEFYKNFN